MKGPSGSPYDFTPKMADFGLYSRVRTVKGGSGRGLDPHGNAQFSESSHSWAGLDLIIPRDVDQPAIQAHPSALTTHAARDH